MYAGELLLTWRQCSTKSVLGQNTLDVWNLQNHYDHWFSAIIITVLYVQLDGFLRESGSLWRVYSPWHWLYAWLHVHHGTRCARAQFTYFITQAGESLRRCIMSLWISRLTRHDYFIRSSSVTKITKAARATFCFPSLQCWFREHAVVEWFCARQPDFTWRWNSCKLMPCCAGKILWYLSEFPSTGPEY